MKRSDTYVMTVDSPNDPAIAQLKEKAKLMGVIRRIDERLGLVHVPVLDYMTPVCYKVTRYRVKVRARLGKNNPNAKLYHRGGSLHRSSAQEIKLEHGTRFDVYLMPEAKYPTTNPKG